MTDITERDTIVPPVDREAPTSPHHEIPDEVLVELEGAPSWVRAVFRKMDGVSDDLRELCDMFRQQAGMMNANLELATQAFARHEAATNTKLADLDARDTDKAKRLADLEARMKKLEGRVTEHDRELERRIDG